LRLCFALCSLFILIVFLDFSFQLCINVTKNVCIRCDSRAENAHRPNCVCGRSFALVHSGIAQDPKNEMGKIDPLFFFYACRFSLPFFFLFSSFSLRSFPFRFIFCFLSLKSSYRFKAGSCIYGSHIWVHLFSNFRGEPRKTHHLCSRVPYSGAVIQ